MTNGITRSNDVPVIVVGAGQAGLAVGHHLQRRGVPFCLLEAGDCVGGSWLTRWDSLTLFTPARFSSLPGRPFPGDPDRFPPRVEVAQYLQAYAQDRGFPIQLSTRVNRVEQEADGLRVLTSAGEMSAAAVVAATGSFQRPRLPQFATELDPGLQQLHTSEYRNPGQISQGRVLVVGAGSSGLQVAAELSATHEVHLSTGTKQSTLPRRVLGRDIFWWLDRLRFTTAPIDRLPKWITGDGNVLFGDSVRRTARRHDVAVHGRAIEVANQEVVFADGGRLRPDAVIWATGYRPDYSWLPAAATDDDGRPVHRRGVSPAPGVYFVGVENQYSSASSLLGWVQRDADFVAAAILSQLDAT